MKKGGVKIAVLLGVLGDSSVKYIHLIFDSASCINGVCNLGRCGTVHNIAPRSSPASLSQLVLIGGNKRERYSGTST